MGAAAAVAVRAAETKRSDAIHLEAVHRRREARKAERKRREAEVDRDDWEARRQREREAAARMARRFYPPGRNGLCDVPHVIVLDYRYWQARRCGLDVLARIFWDGQSDPWQAGTAWWWWTQKHYKTREAFVSTYRRRFGYRLTR